jgi:hypothetical protein
MVDYTAYYVCNHIVYNCKLQSQSCNMHISGCNVQLHNCNAGIQEHSIMVHCQELETRMTFGCSLIAP